MKITFVLPNYPWKPVGGFRVVYEYANQLVRRGHRVTVVHPRILRNTSLPQPNFYRWLRRKAVYLRDTFFRPKLLWQPIDKEIKMLYVPELKARNIPDGDFIFATAWQTAEYVNSYSLCKGKKIYLVQGYEIWSGTEERVNSTWRLPFLKVVIAKWLYEKAVELGVKKSEMVLIPNGINTEKFCLRRAISTRPEKIIMLYNPDECKGFVDGIKALEIVHTSFPDLQMVLFGIFRKPKSLPDWIQYCYNPPSDTLINDIYNSSRIFVCPSRNEGFPLPPAEAMACGCALVSTNNEGVREYAEDGVTALLSPTNDAERLAKNVIRLLKDDDLRIRLAKAGYERIQEFTWERSADLLEHFLSLKGHMRSLV